MYDTVWIDVLSGMEERTYERVLQKIEEFKEEKLIAYAELGLVFEEFDIFAVFETGDSEMLLEFLVDHVAPLEGVMEIRTGNILKISRPLTPLGGGTPSGGDDAGEGMKRSYFMTYLDAFPAHYSRVFEQLKDLSHPLIRYFGYCLDSYDEDVVVCLDTDDLRAAKDFISEKLRKLEGMRDTRTYLVYNVTCL